MRIAHVIDYFHPALGYQETHLARSQAKRGHMVRVVTSNKYSAKLIGVPEIRSILGAENAQIGISIEDGVEVQRLRTISYSKCSNLTWLLGLEQALRSFNPDAVHVHGIVSITSLRVAVLMRQLQRTRLVYDDHMTYSAVRGEWVFPFYNAFRMLAGGVVRNKGNQFVAVTDETKRFMTRFYGIPSDRIKVIPLGCDTTMFCRDSGARASVRRELGIPDTDIVFCYAGKVIEEKGVDILVQAALRLIEETNRVSIMIVGGGDATYLSKLSSYIFDSGFSTHFHFLPHVPNQELNRYYSAADVGIWPKQCSIAMLEAMASGIPVVISSDCGATERVAHGDNGFIYSSGSVDSLRNMMKDCLDAHRLERMSAKAREFSLRLDWDSISGRFEELYSGSPSRS